MCANIIPRETRATPVVLALLIVSTTILGAVGGAAAAESSFDHRSAKPDHVTLTYNESALEEYAPALVTRHLEQDPAAVYGWKATSPERDTDVYVYFTFYPVQRGYSEYDSHPMDREPVYVYVDDGEIVRVQYSAYHYLRGELPGSAVKIQDGTHPTLRVAENYHHYYPSNLSGDPPSHVENLGAEPGSGTFDAWLANGWAAGLDPGSATNPWSMRDRADWWRDGTLGVSAAAIGAQVDLILGTETTVDFGVAENPAPFSLPEFDIPFL